MQMDSPFPWEQTISVDLVGLILKLKVLLVNHFLF